MTPNQLARKIGTSGQSVNQLIRGINKPFLTTAFKIAKALDLSVKFEEDLFFMNNSIDN